LNVTTGAVSRQIKSLENELGVKLFARGKTGIQLTPAAQDLFAELAASFSRCSAAIRAIKTEKRIESVTFACTDAFGTYWLMPRMIDFWSRYPEIVVDHMISEHVRDFRGAEVDLFVRPATGTWPNEYAAPLFEDLIYPVCGATFAQERSQIQVADIASLPLLHMDWTNPDWPRWPDFLQAVSVPFQALRGNRFGKYSLMLAAAESNQGLALGWHSLVGPLIQQGRLVRITDLSMRDPVGFCLAWSGRKALSKSAAAFKAWILDQAASMLCPAELQPDRAAGQ
jgi:DNA-binding transcriptional LysR family regulator